MMQFTICLLFLIGAGVPHLHSAEDPSSITDPNKFRPAPKVNLNSADVVVEAFEILSECELDHICVDGQLYNAGKKAANNLYLRIDIGGTKQIRPRTNFKSKLDETTMNPGDRQFFSVLIPRKMTYKDQGKEKTIEVGKYNFKIQPVWFDNKPKPAPKKKKK